MPWSNANNMPVRFGSLATLTVRQIRYRKPEVNLKTNFSEPCADRGTYQQSRSLTMPV
jgi:hypothetical protein